MLDWYMRSQDHEADRKASSIIMTKLMRWPTLKVKVIFKHFSPNKQAYPVEVLVLMVGAGHKIICNLACICTAVSVWAFGVHHTAAKMGFARMNSSPLAHKKQKRSIIVYHLIKLYTLDPIGKRKQSWQGLFYGGVVSLEAIPRARSQHRKE